MAGRPESPLDSSAGPVARLAAELRKLRAEAGSPTYRSMAHRTGQGASTLSQAAAGDRLPTLPVVVAYVQACGGDAGEWEGRWREAAAEVAAEPRIEDEDAVRPYRGLARFEPGDAGLFFGRGQLTDRLLELTSSRRFTAVFGPSGSGKSSLLRAGLIPRLRAPEATGPQPAALRVLTPGEHPLRAHEQRLIPKDTDGDTWLIVDQFEELYTLCHDPAERDQFIDRLLAATDPGSRLRVVIAVRADFLGRCAEHAALTAALQDGTVLAGPMSRDELREAVVSPAQAGGLVVERSLTARIVDEVEGEPGALPLMSHALLVTWHRRKGRVLTEEAYEAAGGLYGAVARTAERVFSRLTHGQAEVARRILLRLITPGEGTQDTRRPVTRAELGADGPGDVATVLERLARARLITLDHDTADLAHEALITAWPRLRGWIDTDRERLRAHRRLTEAAQAWDGLDRDPGALYRGTRLTAAEEAFTTPDARDDLTTLEHAFLNASFAARDGEQRAATRTTRRLRTLTVTLSALLAVALLASLIAWNQSRNSEHQRRVADAARQVALSRQLAAQSTSLMATDPDLASLLAAQAYRTSPTSEATTSLYSAAASPLKRRLTGHSAWVETIAFSPNGRTMATASDDHTVRLWDAATGRPRTTLTGHKDSVTSVAFSPDGDTVATASDDHTVRLWNPATGRSLRRWHVPTGRTGRGDSDHEDSLGTVAFSPDGHTLATGSADHTVRLWDASTGRLRTPLHIPQVLVSIVFSPDGHTVATVDEIGKVMLWDMATGQPLITLTDADGKPVTVVFSPDGHTAAIAEGDTVRLWDVKTGRSRTPFAGHTDVIRAEAFSPDGHTLATASEDRTVRLWNVSTGQLRTTLPGRTDLAVSLAFSPDGRTLATGSQDGTVRLWDVGTPQPRTTIRHIRYVNSLAFSPDGHIVATGSVDGAARLWDAGTGRLRATMGHIDSPKRALDADPNGVELTEFAQGHTLTTASDDGTVRRWDVATSRPLTLLTGNRNNQNPDSPVALSSDGRTLATERLEATEHPGAPGFQVSLWDLSTGKPRAKLPTFSGVYASHIFVAFNSDGRTLATSAANRSVQLWDSSTGRLKANLAATGSGTLAFSPDGHILAASGAGNTVRLWDVATHQPRNTLSGNQGQVYSLAFSPDGRTLATGSADQTVRLWNVATGQLQITISAPTGGGKLVAFSPDGHTLAATDDSSDHGDTLRLWAISPLNQARAISKICHAVHRDLTAQERSTYLPGAPANRACRS